VAYWRESTLIPLVYGVVLWLVLAVVIPALTHRPAMLDVGVLGDQATRLMGVVLVVALVGALKSRTSILPDVDENAVGVPWQLVLIDVACTTVLICFLSWLVVGR
jgi:hypothetical protein